MREALCLNAKYKKSGTCGELQMSGYAHHAYFPAAGPKYVWKQKDSVTIASLSRLSNALNLAARAHAIPGGVPIYLTEFGVQSKPNKYEGVSAAKQAEYDAIAEHMAYSNPRVAAFSQYLFKDDPIGGPSRTRDRRLRRLPDRPGVRQRPAQAALQRLPGAADGHQARARLLAVGPRAARRPGSTKVTVLVKLEGRAQLPHAEDGHDQRRRLLVLQLLDQGHHLARALGQPGRREVRRSADRRLLIVVRMHRHSRIRPRMRLGLGHSFWAY